jgi:hypothetical protein
MIKRLLFAACLLLAHLVPGVALTDANAAIACSSTNPLACDKGVAYQDCVAHLSGQASSTPDGYTFQNRGCSAVVRNGFDAWQSNCDIKRNSDGMIFAHGCPTWSYYHACPPDKPWNEETKTCGNPCAETKGATLGSGISKGGNENACKGGCEYAPAGSSICMGVGEDAWCGSPSGYVGTGNSCPTESTPNPEACITSGGHTICLKPDGSKCGQFNGRQVCFGNGEAGTKTDGSTLVQAGAGPTAPPAPGPSPGNDPLTQTGGPTTITTTSTTNVTNVVNISTWGTTHGTNAGGTNQGGNTGGTSNTPGGNTGGNTGGDGECEGDNCGDDYGAPAGDGEYKRLEGAAGRTVDGVVSNFKSRMSGAPMINAAGSFFTVSAGGSCPSWTLPATDWTPSIQMDFWCHSGLATAWQLFGYVMLIVYGWVAFRWAFL